MSDAATPETVPAGGPDVVDDVMALLASEAPDTADNAAESDLAAEDAADPDAGDEAEAAEPDQQEEEPPRYRVKVRGEEIEVPLPELLNGYSRTEDYKAKTAEVAEQRRALEAKQVEITARANALESILSQAPLDPILIEGQQTNWTKLAQEDPAGYVARKAAFEERLTQWRNVQQEAERVRTEQYREALRQSDEALGRDVPEWRDEAKRKELTAETRNYLATRGFKPEEIAAIADHRILRVAFDALKHVKASTARQTAEAKKAPAPVPKVMSPGTGTERRSPDTRALLKQARSARDPEARVDAIMRILGS